MNKGSCHSDGFLFVYSFFGGKLELYFFYKGVPTME